MKAGKLEDRVDENSAEIVHIKHSIDVIKDNHLKHIEADIAETKNKIEKIDNRVWAILIILVSSTVISGIVQMMGN